MFDSSNYFRLIDHVSSDTDYCIARMIQYSPGPCFVTWWFIIHTACIIIILVLIRDALPSIILIYCNALGVPAIYHQLINNPTSFFVFFPYLK